MSNPGDPKNPQHPNQPQQPPVGQPPQGQPPQGQPYNAGQPQQYQQPYQAPAGQTYAPHPQGGDSTGGIIPYKNPKALIAYYCGIGGFVPVLGFPVAIAALVLGIMGLRDRKKNPVIKGSVHAWIGIVGGVGGLMLNICILTSIVFAIASEAGNANRGKFTMPNSLQPTIATK